MMNFLVNASKELQAERETTCTELRKNELILGDSSAAISGKLEHFLTGSGTDLKRLGKKLLVTRTTQAVLRNCADSHPTARRALDILAHGYDEGIVDRMEDNMPDNTPERDAIVALLARLRCSGENHVCPILLIAEDERLLEECFQLNQLQSQRGGMINVRRLSLYGTFLQPEFLRTVQMNALAQEADELLPLDHVPKEGDEVWDAGHCTTIRLGSRLAGGGEADIYRVEGYPGLLAKIYHADRHTRTRFQKVTKLAEMDLDDPRICKPLLALYGPSDASTPGAGFCGCLMRAAVGIPLSESIFIPRQLEQDHPDWDKSHLVRTAVAILDVLYEVHRRGLLVGDLSGNNILVGSTPEQIAFVDVDSWCVGNLGTAVETEGFLAPELIRAGNLGLRTMESEYFAVSVLLFELLVTPGRNPYTDGGDLLQNILEGRFAYPLGNDTGVTPPAPYIYCWSHIPYHMKYLFHESLSANGSCYAPEQRPTVQEWSRACRKWKRMFDTEHIADKESYRIIPTRHKIKYGSVAVTCALCGKEKNQDYCQKAEDGTWYCSQCLHVAVEGSCECGAPIRYSNYDRYILRKPCPEYCEECEARRKAPPKIVVGEKRSAQEQLLQVLMQNGQMKGE